MSRHFRDSHYIIKEILGRQLGLMKFSRRWVWYRLSDDQKATRVRDSRVFLAILPRLQDNFFEGISTGDESRFLYEYQSESMFTASREAVPPRCEHKIQAKKIMITIFFTPMRLLVVDTLPYGQTFTQDYFITEVFPMLREQNMRFRHKHSRGSFFLHMDNSLCDNSKKITAEIEHQRFARAPHPLYSPNLNPCDFWLFGLIKYSLKDREIQGFKR
jgi:histone-lysine N-methyltransferase SETMAR